MTTLMEIGGACVWHKTLVRIDTSSAECRSRLHNIMQQEAEHHSNDVVSEDTVLHGWVVASPSDDSGCWCIFVFALLRNVLLPCEFLNVESIITGSLALGDLLVAFRHSEHRSSFQIDAGDDERKSLQIIAMHSKLLQLQQDEDLELSPSQAAFHVCRYRDWLDSTEAEEWHAHVFLPEDEMLPSFLLLDLQPA